MAQRAPYPCVVFDREVCHAKRINLSCQLCSGWLNSCGSSQMPLYVMMTLLHDETSLVPIQVCLVSDNIPTKLQCSEIYSGRPASIRVGIYECTTAFACLCTVVWSKNNHIDGVNLKISLFVWCMHVSYIIYIYIYIYIYGIWS